MKNPFTNKTVAEIKALWLELVYQYHPDTSGYESTEDFQDLNNFYHQALKGLHQTQYQNTKTGETHTYYYNQAREAGAIDTIEQLIKAGFSDDVSINLVGTWVWVEGIKFGSHDMEIHKTLKHQSNTKKNGQPASLLNWHSKRKLYYWKPNGSFSKFNKTATFDDLKEMYGHTEFQPDEASRPVGALGC